MHFAAWAAWLQRVCRLQYTDCTYRSFVPILARSRPRQIHQSTMHFFCNWQCLDSQTSRLLSRVVIVIASKSIVCTVERVASLMLDLVWCRRNHPCRCMLCMRSERALCRIRGNKKGGETRSTKISWTLDPVGGLKPPFLKCIVLPAQRAVATPLRLKSFRNFSSRTCSRAIGWPSAARFTQAP